MNLSYRLNQFFWGGLDWLFPPVCGGCDRPGYLWFPECQHQVHTLPEPICEMCGVPINHPGKCGFCRDHLLPYKEMRSWLVFDVPIRRALHGLKYRLNITLGIAIARHVSSFISGLDWHVDMIVPIPLGRKRLKERGYNQAGLVVGPLAVIRHRTRVEHQGCIPG